MTGQAAGRTEVEGEAGGPAGPLTLLAAETRRLYATDWRSFVAWCRSNGQVSLPASPETVAAYLTAQSGGSQPLASGALSRRAAAIAERHQRSGHLSPTMDPSVRVVLRAARRATAEKRKEATSRVPAKPGMSALPTPFPRGGKGVSARAAAQLVTIAARCPGDLAGLRDRALLLLVAAGVDGETLLGLDREHVRLDNSSLELYASADRPGLETPMVVRRGASAASCPVRALDTWLRVSDTRFGPVFRKVDRWGNLEHQRLRADGLRRIWLRRALAARRGRARLAAS